ncbi:hypothetical protein GF380_04150 [Candidatus Uhrbacteria bacterium]|nr:hypothetical protein [Candidatus Uhrbacteria bacterium]MBD3284277.1 hypothetical protein [Candidatus Uhrbacteria bacterium]
MEKLFVLFLIVLNVAGCGGRTNEDAEEHRGRPTDAIPNARDDRDAGTGGGSAGAPMHSAGTGGSAGDQASAGSAGEPSVGGQAGSYTQGGSAGETGGNAGGSAALDEYKLIATFHGPDNTSYIRPETVTFLDVTLMSFVEDLELNSLQFTLKAHQQFDRVKGRSGESYFRNLRIVDADTGATLMGPVNFNDTEIAENAKSASLLLNDPFVLEKGDSRRLLVIGDTHPTDLGYVEMVFKGNVGILFDQILSRETNEPLESSDVSTDLIEGNPFYIQPRVDPLVTVQKSANAPMSGNVYPSAITEFTFVEDVVVNGLGHPIGLERIEVRSGGPSWLGLRDFEKLHLYIDNTYCETIVLDQLFPGSPTGQLANTWFHPGKSCVGPHILLPGTKKTLRVTASMNTPVAPAVAAEHSPLSGDAISLRISQVYFENGGSRATIEDATQHSIKVLRKSVPTLTKLQLPQAELMNGIEVALAKWGMYATQTENIAWRSIMFQLEHTHLDGLSNLKLYVGSVEMQDATIVKVLKDGPGEYIIVSLPSEEIVGGLGQTYTLRATPSFPSGSNASIRVEWKPMPSLADGTFMGAIACYDPSGDVAMPYWLTTTQDFIGETPTNLMWSDMSELPHGGNCGQSMDWINDWQVGGSMVWQQTASP